MSLDPQADRGAEPTPPRGPRVKTIICVATLAGVTAGYVAKDSGFGVTVFSAVVAALKLDPDR
jgi:hypothetical protein